MKTTKRIKFSAIIIVLLLSALSVSGQQQGQGQGQGRGQGSGGGRTMTEDDVKQRVERLSEALEMSDEQEAEMLKYELDAYKKNQVERQKLRDAGDREAMRAYMKKQVEIRDVKYKEILTEAQMEEYAKLQEERRQQMQDRNKERDSQNGDERSDRGRGR